MSATLNFGPSSPAGIFVLIFPIHKTGEQQKDGNRKKKHKKSERNDDDQKKNVERSKRLLLLLLLVGGWGRGIKEGNNDSQHR